MSEFNCEKIDLLLSAYHDGELEGEEHAKVEAHLHVCPDCSKSLAELRIISQSIKNLPRVKAKKDYAQDFDQLIASRESKVAYFRRPAVWATVSVAAAACIVVVFGHFHQTPATSDVANVPTQKPESAAAPQKPQAAPPEQIAVAPVEKPAEHPSINPAQPEAVTAKKEASVPKIATSNAAEPSSPQAANVLKEGTAESSQDLIALYGADENVSTTEELGISTDEDGLYAIKL